MKNPEFDRYAASYDSLLKDPIRDRFTGTNSEAFHRRKRDVILRYLRGRHIAAKSLAYLDVGCGRGDLMAMLLDDFGSVAGCDPSASMMASAAGVPVRVQDDPASLPYGAETFDFVTAVCVYHHVAPEARPALTRDVVRVLKPGGVFAIIEHNPYNPMTRLIVNRSPVDADANLLSAFETARLMRGQRLVQLRTEYFLYLPESLYRYLKPVERWFAKMPMGGQFAVFGVKPG